jgi:hypothetical protein
VLVCLEAYFVTGQYKGDMVVYNCISVVTGTRLHVITTIDRREQFRRKDGQRAVSRTDKVLIVITREAVGQRSRHDDCLQIMCLSLSDGERLFKSLLGIADSFRANNEVTLLQGAIRR